MNKNIFIAIDTSNIKQAKKIILETQTKDLNIAYKFGLEFWYSKGGRSFISQLNKKHIIFADLKISDIPNTAKSAINSLKDLKNLQYITIHINSGYEALMEVKKIAKKINKNLKILGVSVLTSFSDGRSFREIGHTKSIKQVVTQSAKLANKLKLDGLEINSKPTIKDAISSLTIKDGEIILITGSLYLAGEVLNLN